MYKDFDHRLFANGLSALSDRQVLETMLCNVVSREEIDAITREVGSSFLDLMNFGYERLSYFDSISHKTACYIEYLREFASRYLVSSYINSIGQVLDTSEKMCEYFKRLFTGINREEIHAVGLDDGSKLICGDMVSSGNPNNVEVSLRKVSEFVILNNISRVVFAHNHPQGYSDPSENDIISTKHIVNFLMEIDVEVMDIIIVGIYCAYSLRSSIFFSRVWI